MIIRAILLVAVAWATISPSTVSPTPQPTELPTTEQPTTETPTTETPTTVAPTTETPTTTSPTTEQPTEAPTTEQPTEQPTEKPTDEPTEKPTDQPTGPPTNPNAQSGAPPGIGYLCAGLAVLFFGSNFIPVKRYKQATGDGMFFQWVMCTAIFMAGIAVQFYLEIENPNKQTVFEPIATLGGVLWCTGNVLSVPVIQCIGMGLGLLIWGAANLSAGWASSFFGILGQPKSPVPKEGLNVAGAMVCLSSLLFFFFVKTASDTGKIVNDEETDDNVENRLYNGAESDEGASELLGRTRDGTWTDRLSPKLKKVVGFSFAIIAGIFFGVNFNPPFYLIGANCAKLDSQNDCVYHSGKDRCLWDTPTSKCVENPACIHSKDSIDYVFAHFTGIFLASTTYFLIYCCIKLATKSVPYANARIVVPGFLSGLGWAVAQISWFVANGSLSPVISFPIVTTGPGLVAAFWGVVIYHEIQGARNFFLLGGAFMVVVVGIILITFSKED